MTTLFVDRNSIKTLLTLEEIGNLKNIICFDIIDEEIASQLKAKKLRCFSYLQLIEEGKLLTNLNNDQINVQKNDCYTFSYTSGTTGPPKGAMISHKNMLACTCTFLENNDVSFENADDRYLSYLPLPHLL
jgi:long-chain acyl-CoA synthetase